MDNKLAINLLKHHINTWKGKFPSNHFKACKIAIISLQKQIPIKPHKFLRYIGPCKSYECSCGNCVFEYEQYCSYCGQRLDWNKEE